MDGEPDVLLVTRDAALRACVERLCVPSGQTVRVEETVDAARGAWSTARTVVLDAVAVEGGPALPSRRDRVVLASWGRAAPWAAAASTGVDQVVALPEGQEWLAHRLRHPQPPSRAGGPGRVVGVVGGRGGAGVTTLAAALALTAAREGGHPVLLADLDPVGSGADLVVGAHDRPGLRWTELAGTRGRVSRPVLRETLPRVGEVSVLSWPLPAARGPHEEPVPPEAVESVLDAGSREFPLAVLDLPRRWDAGASAALAAADDVVLLVPAEVRATLSATRTLAALRGRDVTVHLVVRQPGPGGLRAEQVGEALGLEATLRLRDDPRLPAATDRGEPPAADGRGPLADLCRELLAVLGRRPGSAWSSTRRPA